MQHTFWDAICCNHGRHACPCAPVLLLTSCLACLQTSCRSLGGWQGAGHALSTLQGPAVRLVDRGGGRAVQRALQRALLPHPVSLGLRGLCMWHGLSLRAAALCRQHCRCMRAERTPSHPTASSPTHPPTPCPRAAATWRWAACGQACQTTPRPSLPPWQWITCGSGAHQCDAACWAGLHWGPARPSCSGGGGSAWSSQLVATVNNITTYQTCPLRYLNSFICCCTDSSIPC